MGTVFISNKWYNSDLECNACLLIYKRLGAMKNEVVFINAIGNKKNKRNKRKETFKNQQFFP